MKRLHLLLLLGVVLAGGCAVPPAQEGRVPEPGATTTPPEELNSPAVAELSAQAQDALAGGRYDAAAQFLERAIRIEPRNGRLWYELARVRYEQGNFEQAMQLANRSNALPGTGAVLKTKNDQLIDASRSALGN